MKKGTVPLLIGIVVIAAITVAMTVYAASLTGRWGEPMGIAEARVSMKALPMEIGNWRAEEERSIGDTAVKMLRIQDSYILRTYRNTVTGDDVHVTLMVGPSGKVSVHNPEICFGGRAYTMESARSRVPVNVLLQSGDEIDDTFFRVDFVGQSLDVNNRISFYWGISTGGAWNAVEQPRFHFRKFRFIYKLQAEAYSGAGDDSDIVKRFLEDCLPTIHSHLYQCR